MGYFLIDNRGMGEGVFETDTVACKHCQAVIDKRKWREDKGIFYCSKCAGPLCHHCTKIGKETNFQCDPWEQKIEREVKIANQLIHGGDF